MYRSCAGLQLHRRWWSENALDYFSSQPRSRLFSLPSRERNPIGSMITARRRKRRRRTTNFCSSILQDLTGAGGALNSTRIFSRSRQFKDYAHDNLVLVELDFPRKKSQPTEERKQNVQLAQQDQVLGFPTIVVLNSSGQRCGSSMVISPAARRRSSRSCKNCQRVKHARSKSLSDRFRVERNSRGCF